MVKGAGKDVEAQFIGLENGLGGKNMSKQLTYIELKTGYSDNGPAWIGLVEFSKTRQSLYFDDKALKRKRIPGSNSNHYDIETGDDYWVSGVKKMGLTGIGLETER